VKRTTIMLLMVALLMMVATAVPAFAAPKQCPPGQTATVTVVGTELVTTCRVL
jgi:hypothetical protein